MILTVSTTRKGYDINLGRRSGINQSAVLYPSIADGLVEAKSVWQTAQERCCPLCHSVANAHGGLWRLGGVDVAMNSETIAVIKMTMDRFANLPQSHAPTQLEMLNDPDNQDQLKKIREVYGEWFVSRLEPPRGGWRVALAIPPDKYKEASSIGAFSISGVATYKELPRNTEWIYEIQSRIDACFKASMNQIANSSSGSAWNKAKKLVNILNGCADQFGLNAGDGINPGNTVTSPIRILATVVDEKIGVWETYRHLMVSNFTNEVLTKYNEQLSLLKNTEIYYTDDVGEVKHSPLAEFVTPWDPMNSFAVAVGGGIKADVDSLDLDEEL